MSGAGGMASGVALGWLVTDFSLRHVNPNSARYNQAVSPKDQATQVWVWYFGKDLTAGATKVPIQILGVNGIGDESGNTCRHDGQQFYLDPSDRDGEHQLTVRAHARLSPQKVPGTATLSWRRCRASDAWTS